MPFRDLMLGLNKILIPLGNNSVIVSYKWSMIQIPQVIPLIDAQLLSKKRNKVMGKS